MSVRIDQAIMRLLNRGAANGAFDWLMPRLTHLDHYVWFMVISVALVIWLLARGGMWGRAWVLCAVLAVGLSDWTAYRIVKTLANRTRPCYQVNHHGPYAFPDDRLVGQCPGSASFPSNHASNMMALGVVCWWFTRLRAKRKAWSLLWFFVPLVIGYTRIYLGVHYPTDVVGGWVFGALIAAIVIRAVAVPLLRLPSRATEPSVTQPDGGRPAAAP